MPRKANSEPDRKERRRNKRRLDRLNSPKPPRCPNRFILYRRHKQNEFFNDPSKPINMRKLSRAIAKMWEKEPPEIKNYWDQVAEREKLNSSYRTSFDVINGLDIDIPISMHSDNSDTFVHATASSTETHQGSTTNNISEDFIFEFEQEPTTPPESPEPFTNESSQPTSDDDAGSTTFDLSNLSLSSFTDEPIEPTELQTLFIDPMLTEPNMPTMFGEFSYFSDEHGFLDLDGLYTSNFSPLPADEREEGYLPPIEDEMFFVEQF